MRDTNLIPFPVVVRWSNGDIEGLVGWGRSRESAREEALYRIRSRTAAAGEHLQVQKLLEHDALLSRREAEKVRRDWSVDGYHPKPLKENELESSTTFEPAWAF